MTAASVCLDTAPIINALQHMLTIFRDLEFDYYKPAVLSQRQKIDWSNAELGSACGSELRMQRRDNQTRIEHGDVSSQQRLEPCFRSCAIQSVAMIEGRRGSVLATIA